MLPFAQQILDHPLGLMGLDFEVESLIFVKTHLYLILDSVCAHLTVAHLNTTMNRLTAFFHLPFLIYNFLQICSRIGLLIWLSLFIFCWLLFFIIVLFYS